MKKLLIVLFSLGLAVGASAQYHGGHGWGGHYYAPRPRVSVGIGLGLPLYSPFGYYGYGNPYYGYPPIYGGGYRSRSSGKLALQIQDIENDYHERIWAAKHDKSISHRARRQEVHRLKSDREKAINEAKRNYYRR